GGKCSLNFFNGQLFAGGLGSQVVVGVEVLVRAGQLFSAELIEVFFRCQTSSCDSFFNLGGGPLTVGFCVKLYELRELASQVIFFNEPGGIRHFQHSKGDKSELANGQLVYVVRATSKR